MNRNPLDQQPGNRAGPGSGRTIPRRSAAGATPLSFAQQRLWFLDQLEPGKPLYHVCRGLRLTGRLYIRALENALRVVVARHEVLRTVIRLDGPDPVQLVRHSTLEQLPIVDLSERAESQRSAEMALIAQAEADRPFDLAEDLMVRAKLVRFAAEDHVLLLTLHHIASDGWSLAIFFRELSAAYGAFVQGRSPALPPLPIQYADYAAWQREWLRGRILEQQSAYWRKQLNGLAALQLPADRPRRAAQSHRGARQSLVLSRDLSEKLKALSRKQGVSLFMPLLAAFQALLCRYSDQEDIAVGCPIAGRNRLELEGLIGFFANTLVLRADLSGNPTFKDHLARVRETALDAYAHQDIPFEKLVEELQPERDLSRSPLFQVMFVLQNTPNSAPQLSGLTAELMEFDRGTAKFDLSLAMYDEPSGLRASLEYATDLFDAPTIERMLGHFQILLESVVSDPDRRIGDLAVLTEGEKRRLLIEWNNANDKRPSETPVHRIFEQRAAQAADAVALLCANERMTYAELNRKANQLARYLRRLGAAPETLVGVSFERSADMIVALLAILKSGAAYLPLDPDYPPERLAFILHDTQAVVLLTQKPLLDRLVEDRGSRIENRDLRSSILDPRLKVVCLDTDWEVIARESDVNPAGEITADNLAYVIYTSGSTGQPKGVMISHGSIASHCLHVQDYYRLNESDRVLQFGSISFDASLEQILPTLMSGATLVLRDEQIWTPQALIEKAYDRQFTVMNLPTAYWHQVAQAAAGAGERGAPDGLRLVIVGGEEMPARALELWRQTAFGEIPLLNAYGPTETAITATAYRVPAEYASDDPSGPVPIGRPLGERQVFLLDRHANVVPIGVTGELHIGGESLARGYLNRPALTAEKFIPHPFSRKPGARLYGTGDLARYLPDGNIQFLGRRDHQVKIRGFRIELGEIESVLREHPDVSEAIVVPRQDEIEDRESRPVTSINSGQALSEVERIENRKSETCTELSRGIANPKSQIENLKSDRRLVAYVVAADGSILGPDKLRTFLKQMLPDYMVPSTFVFLDRLPVSPNGKVDRLALPAPNRAAARRTLVPARTPYERTLAGIWAEILDLAEVGVEDNFFDLGGHSLLATRLVSRIRDLFQVDVPVRAVFENPTIAELAQHLARMDFPEADARGMKDILADLESLSDEEAKGLVVEGNTTRSSSS